MTRAFEQFNHPDDVKVCCAAVYDSPWTRLLLGDSFHPGGLALTTKIGQLLQLTPDDHVLDVAAGQGMSAIHLAQTFGCRVTGLEYSQKAVAAGQTAVAQAELSHLVTLQQGDAESLPFDAAHFDVLLCECAFCTFPNKPAAAAEMARVLKPNGRLGISDLTRQGELPPELNTLMAWIACIADAQPISTYQQYLENAGLSVTAVMKQDKALADMVKDVQGKVLGAELMVKLKKIAWPNADFSLAKTIAKSAAEQVGKGTLGYAVLIGTKGIARP